MRISFCTACQNRFHQFKHVFDRNVQVIIDNPQLEWVVLDYSSSDGLDEFMQQRLAALPPGVVYVATEQRDLKWHTPIAKNTAHRWGSGDFLMNIDADNRIGDVSLILEHIAAGRKVIHQWSGQYRDGTCGRIGVERELFHRLGGYDEEFLPMGYQDLDLLERANALGYPKVEIPCAEIALQNSKEESMANCGVPELTWSDCHLANMRRSQYRRAVGKLIANEGREWGSLHVKRYASGAATTPSPARPAADKASRSA